MKVENKYLKPSITIFYYLSLSLISPNQILNSSEPSPRLPQFAPEPLNLAFRALRIFLLNWNLKRKKSPNLRFRANLAGLNPNWGKLGQKI